MADGILGNSVGAFGFPKTFTLVDENNNEYTGVIVGQETIFTAGDNDVREGMVYASDNGVSTGTKDIPSYHTIEGYKLISSGSNFSITNFAEYEYTKLLVMICVWNTKLSDSVAVEKIVINGKVYAVGSTEALSEVTINAEDKSINLGITNDSGSLRVLRYITYKEEY